MPRAKTPDPLVVEHVTPGGRTYTIRAFKDGAFEVIEDDKVVAGVASQLGAYFGAPKWPSLRFQAEALENAKLRANGLHR